MQSSHASGQKHHAWVLGPVCCIDVHIRAPYVGKNVRQLHRKGAHQHRWDFANLPVKSRARMDCAPGSSFISHPWNYFHSSTPFQPFAGAQLNLAKAPKGQGMAQHLGSKKWQGTRMRLCELFSNFSSSRVWSVTHCLRMTLTSIGTMMFAK